MHAVLFFSPTCPHCQRVIENVLPPMFAHFGGAPQFHPGTVAHILTNGRLEMLLVDATQRGGPVQYRSSIMAHELTPERQGVPQLVCGDSVLVGEFEIPDRFPAIIRAGLAHGGVPWPDIAGLDEVFPRGYGPRATAGSGTVARAPAPPAAGAAAAVSGGGPRPEGVHAAAKLVTQLAGSPFRRTLGTDPVGGWIALVILAAMVLSLGLALTRVPAGVPRVWERAVPVILVAGLAIAAYLSYVDLTGAAAVCGPVGNCNAVQQSRYARLAGIPVAVIGLAGYAAILLAWIGSRVGSPDGRRRAAVAAFALSVLGTIASAVLTALEPFAIGAVCTWCLTSAVLMTLLLWLLARPARDAAATPGSAAPGS